MPIRFTSSRGDRGSRCSPPAGRANRYVAPPPPQGGRRQARLQHECHALSRGNRHARGGEYRRSRGAHSGLRAGDQVQGRRAREEGHVAVHDRARALQGQARSGAGRRRRRQGAGPESAQAEFERQADLVKRQVSTQANYDKALAQRDTDKANRRTGPGQHRDRQDQSTAIPR